MSELLYKIAITKIPKVGAVVARNLISYCGGVKAVFEAKKKDLVAIPGIGPQIAQSIVNQKVLREAEEELKFIEKHNIKLLFYLDRDYPTRLKHYNDSPILLFYKGNTQLNHNRIVSIVGTRKPSIHGITLCEDLVEGLKPYGVVVVSGLAYGIDVTAHRKCLKLGIETIGVVAHGLSMIYPSQHRSIAEKMIQQGGLLTEHTSKIGPEKDHFPIRNRIIAGLCDALVVVETAKKGGSMISAAFANNYNKDVFAIPGRIKDAKSKGCNFLIKTHRANLLESVEDIAYIMQWDKEDKKKTVQRQLFVELSEKERFIVNHLRGHEYLSIDRITHIVQLSPSKTAALMLNLELKGVVRVLAGKRYVLV